jgi:hypothetical protein
MLDKHTLIALQRQTVSGDDYRELAFKIREIARQSRLPVARRELLRLAANYDQRAGHLDQASLYWRGPAALVSTRLRVEIG